MKITIEMNNGLVVVHELDEMLLDRATMIPVNYVMGAIRPGLEECVSRRHEKAPG